MRTIAITLLGSLAFMLAPTAFAARPVPNATPKRANCFDLALSVAKTKQAIGIATSSSGKKSPKSAANTTVRAGLTIKQNGTRYYVSSVEPGLSAESAGLRPGDEIRGINGVLLKQQYTAEELLAQLNGPEGTTVIVDIGRMTASGKTSVTLRRLAAVTTTAYQTSIRGNAAHVIVRSLDAATTKAIRTWLQTAEAQAAKGVILDLRSNPYGDMQSLMELLSAVLPKGTPMGLIMGAKKSQPLFTEKAAVIGSGQRVIAMVNEGGFSGIITRYALRIGMTPPATIIVASKSLGLNAVQAEQMSFASLLKGDDARQYCSERNTFTWDLIYKDEIIVPPVNDKDAPLDRALELLQ